VALAITDAAACNGRAIERLPAAVATDADVDATGSAIWTAPVADATVAASPARACGPPPPVSFSSTDTPKQSRAVPSVAVLVPVAPDEEIASHDTATPFVFCGLFANEPSLPVGAVKEAGSEYRKNDSSIVLLPAAVTLGALGIVPLALSVVPESSIDIELPENAINTADP